MKCIFSFPFDDELELDVRNHVWTQIIGPTRTYEFYVKIMC